jgi:Bax protein
MEKLIKAFRAAARVPGEVIIWCLSKSCDRFRHFMRRAAGRVRPRLRLFTDLIRAQKAVSTIAAVFVVSVALGIISQIYPEIFGDRPADGPMTGARLSQLSPEEANRVFTAPYGMTVVSASADKLFKDFRRIGYRLEDVRKGVRMVPRVFVKVIPGDIKAVEPIATRKAVFIKTLLPLVLQVNEELRGARARIESLTRRSVKGAALAPAEKNWLASQYQRFGVAEGDVAALLLRVDIIPPSLALAQGAEESGWGTSRFALQGQALFGQRTREQGPGIVPLRRAKGSRFKIKTFDRLLDAVQSYAHNLNTNAAYGDFRRLRAQLRKKSGGAHGIDSFLLVEGLLSYSERGVKYVEKLKSIMRANDLKVLDGARLSRTLGGAEKLAPV